MSYTWQANLMSADEAMLGGIPDREAPLPLMPKAKPSVLSRRVAEFQDVVLQRSHPEPPAARCEAYPHSFILSPGFVKPSYSEAWTASPLPFDGRDMQTSGRISVSPWRSVPAPLEPDGRLRVEAPRQRSFSFRAPLGCTISMEQAPVVCSGAESLGPSKEVPASVPSAVLPTSSRTSGVTPCSSSTSVQLTGSSTRPCRSVQFVNAEANPTLETPGSGSVQLVTPQASVVPAVIAPSSPCITPSGTPQTPCRPVQFVNPQAPTLLTSASVVPAVIAPSSPCITPSGTPQTPCRPVQFVNPQAPTLLTSASVVPAVIAPSSPCITPSGTPQTPCRPVQFVNPQAPTLLTSASVVPAVIAPSSPSIAPSGTLRTPCRSVMNPVVWPAVTSPGGRCQATTSPTPLMTWSSGFWTQGSSGSVASRRSSSPLRCLPVKHSRQQRDGDEAADFESILAEARIRLKAKAAKVDGLVSALSNVGQREEETQRSQRLEDNAPPKSTAPFVASECPPPLRGRPKVDSRPQPRKSPATAPSVEFEFSSLAKLEALLGKSANVDSRPPPRKSPAPLESTDFSSLGKLEALLAQSSKSESPRRRPSDLQKVTPGPLEASEYDTTGKSLASQRSSSSQPEPDAPSDCRRPLFASGSKEQSPMSRAVSQEWLSSWSPTTRPKSMWDLWSEEEENGTARSLVTTQSVPTLLVEGRDFTEPKGADVAGGLRSKASQPELDDFDK